MRARAGYNPTGHGRIQICSTLIAGDQAAESKIKDLTQLPVPLLELVAPDT
jgi:hypothetical protein